MCDQIKKQCSVCEEFKILDDFYKGNALYGKSTWCKDCMSAHNKKKREENKEMAQVVYDSYDQNKDKKACKRCGRNLLVSFFTKNLHVKDGLASYCKNCCCIIQRTRGPKSYWNKQGKEKSKTKIKTKSGNVYLMINNVNGRIKIGRTTRDPVYREKTLQSQEPEIDLLFYKNVLFMMETEKYLHRFFKRKRFRGEWFDLSEDDIKKAKSIIEKGVGGSLFSKVAHE